MPEDGILRLFGHALSFSTVLSIFVNGKWMLVIHDLEWNHS